MVVDSCTVSPIEGSQTGVLARWPWPFSDGRENTDHFVLEWEYQIGSGEWVNTSQTSVNYQLSSDGHVTTTWNVPSNQDVRYVRLKLLPVARDHQVSYTNADGSTGTRTEPWWSGDYRYSNVCESPTVAYERLQAAEEAARKAAEAATKRAAYEDEMAQYRSYLSQANAAKARGDAYYNAGNLSAANASYAQAEELYARADDSLSEARRHAEDQAAALAEARANKAREEALSQARERAAKPDAPTSVSARLSGSYALVTFSCTAKWATLVRVFRSVDGGSWAQVAERAKRGSDSWTDTGLAAGHSYRYAAQAVLSNRVTASDLSVPSSSVEREPAACTGLAAALAAPTSVRLTFANQGKVGSSYEVQYSDVQRAWANNSTGDIKTLAVDGTVTSITIPNLADRRTWWFRLRRKSSAGYSGWATAASGKSKADAQTVKMDIARYVQVVTVPPHTRLSARQAGTQSVRLDWHDPGYPGDTTEIQYTRSATAFANEEEASITTATFDGAPQGTPPNGTNHFTVGGLATGYTWHFRVRRKEDEWWSAWTAAVSVTLPLSSTADLPVAPIAPSGLTAERRDETSVTLRWTCPDQTADGMCTEVWYSSEASAFLDNAMGAIKTATLDDVSGGGDGVYSLTDLERGNTWHFMVRRRCDTGVSAWANAVGDARESAYVVAVTLPAEQEALESPTVTSTLLGYEADATVRLAWTHNSAADSDQSGYQIELMVTDRGATTGEPVPVRLSALGRDADGRGVLSLPPSFSAMADVGTISCVESDGSASTTTVHPTLDSSGWEFAQTEAGYEAHIPWDTFAADAGWESASFDGSFYAVPRTYLLEGGTDAWHDVALAASPILAEDGSQMSWRVRTAGVAEGVWSPWSRIQTFRTWARPVASLSLADSSGASVGAGAPLGSLPLTMAAAAHSSLGGDLDDENRVVAWWCEVAAAEDHERVEAGVSVGVARGTVLWSCDLAEGDEGFSPLALERTVVAGDAHLVGGQAYVCRAGCVTAQGMRGATPDAPFSVEWSGPALPEPTATVAFDADALSCRVWPRCQRGGAQSYVASSAVDVDGLPATVPCASEPAEVVAYARDAEDNEWVGACSWEWDADAGAAVVEGAEGMPDGYAAWRVRLGWDEDADATALASVTERVTELPHLVRLPSPAASGDSVGVVAGGATMADGWAYDADLAAVLLGEGAPLAGAGEVTVTWEPVTSGGGSSNLRAGTWLDVYRMDGGTPVAVATGLANDGTCEVVDPHPPLGSATYRVVARDAETGAQSWGDATVETPAACAVVQWDGDARRADLSLDLRVEEGHALDAELVEYAGRAAPVSYYGTQRGETASISCSVERGDADLLRLLRELSAWRGDCYVRTPAGTGGWAHVDVTLTHAHDSGACAATLAVTMVEGGA